jgi:hypothetical protein
VTPVRRWVAVAVVLPVLAAGCSDDPEPRFEPSPSPTESTSSAAPEPKAWEVKSEAGAVAFAKHWIDVFNEATRSGDAGEVRAASTETCGTCSRFADGIDDLYQGGGSIESQGWKVVQAVPTSSMVISKPRIALRIRQSPQRVTQKNGEVRSFPGGRETFSARLVWTDSQWLMNDLVLIR